MSNELKRRNDERLDAFGEIFFAVPVIQEWVRLAEQELEAGASDEHVRELVLQGAADEGITLSRVLFPGVNRKARRLSLLKVANALVAHFMRVKHTRKLGEAIDAFAVAVGYDRWLADAVLHKAKTGESPSMFGLAAGKVWVHESGIGGVEEPSVWAIATPYCDPREMADEFYEKCKEVFPAHTWNRTARNSEAAGFCARRIQGASDEQIAEENLGEEELARLSALGPKVRDAQVALEADRVRKARQRYMAYLDSIPDELSG